MHIKLTTTFSRIVNGPVPVLVAACVIAAIGSLPIHAEFTDPAPVLWSVVDGTGNPEDQNNWIAYEVGGEVLYDAEGGTSNDSTNGGASFTGSQDIASNYPPAVADPGCTAFDEFGDTQCGDAVSAFFYYHVGGGGIDTDVLFARMRVDGDPRSGPGFDGGHWNFLLDVEQAGALDGYKELWIDVNGNYNGGSKADAVRILYENNASNDVTNDDGALGSLPDAGTCGGLSKSGGSVINAFVACSSANNTDADCQNASGEDLSHTRIVDIGDGSGEFYVDVMVPVSALRDSEGCYSYPKKFTDPEVLVEGNQIIYDPSMFALLYSTSNSATDPLQKDFVLNGFGDPASTPVTLASFEARAEGGKVRIEWTTATETANVGFDIYELVGKRWQRVNERLVPSNAVNSTTPQHYVFEADGSSGSVFKIVDISTDIRTRGHGPFELGRSYGRPATAEPVDWAAVRREHKGKEGARRTAATSVAQKSLTAGAARMSLEKKKDAEGQSPVCNLGVSEDGLYRVTAEELTAAGCDLDGANPGDIALTNRGESVQIRVVASRRTFGPGDFIEFYGEAEESVYTRTNVYRLHLDAKLAEPVKIERHTPGARDEAPAAYTESLFVDDNRAYHFMSPTGDPWYDTRLLANAGTPLSVNYPLQVDHLGEGGATLHVGLWGVTNWPDTPDHHVRVLLNGNLLWDEYFDGLVNVPLSIELADGLLHEGENTLTLLLPGDTGVRFDMVNLDTYGVEYPRAFVARDGKLAFEADAKVFEVGGLHSDEVVVYGLSESKKGVKVAFADKVEIWPSEDAFSARFASVSGGGAVKYVVSTVDRLLTPAIDPPRAAADIVSGSAEYLVITHPDFLEGLAPLVNAREAQGWQVRIVDVDDVFAGFSFGIFDPRAIRDYIAHAVGNMGTRAVLLVGGDTFDYLDYLGVGSMSFVPTLYTDTGSGAVFTPTDALLADGDGDLIPDVAIGRLPVRTGAELAAIISKILAYETRGDFYTAVYAAGRDEARAPFTETSLALVNELPGTWHVTRAHIDDLGVEGARAALLEALDDGVALTTFVGHSGPNRWTYEGLFSSADVGLLSNAGAPTVVSQWGCWNTYFVEPEVNTMAHALLLSEGTGAAAVLGASAVTTYRQDDAFAPLLQKHLTQPGKPIGEAILDAKRDLAELNPSVLEIILGINLLGDPGMVVAP